MICKQYMPQDQSQNLFRFSVAAATTAANPATTRGGFAREINMVDELPPHGIPVRPHGRVCQGAALPRLHILTLGEEHAAGQKEQREAELFAEIHRRTEAVIS